MHVSLKNKARHIIDVPRLKIYSQTPMYKFHEKILQ